MEIEIIYSSSSSSSSSTSSSIDSSSSSSIDSSSTSSSYGLYIPFCDDFDGVTIDSDIWNVLDVGGASVTQSGGQLLVGASGDNNYGGIYAVQTLDLSTTQTRLKVDTKENYATYLLICPVGENSIPLYQSEWYAIRIIGNKVQSVRELDGSNLILSNSDVLLPSELEISINNGVISFMSDGVGLHSELYQLSTTDCFVYVFSESTDAFSGTDKFDYVCVEVEASSESSSSSSSSIDSSSTSSSSSIDSSSSLSSSTSSSSFDSSSSSSVDSSSSTSSSSVDSSSSSSVDSSSTSSSSSLDVTEMVIIPGGKFLMGWYLAPDSSSSSSSSSSSTSSSQLPGDESSSSSSSSGVFLKKYISNTVDPIGADRELPEHEASVDSFYISKYQVTYDLYKEVYDWALVNGYNFDIQYVAGELPNIPSSGGGGAFPVIGIAFINVVKWCNARSEKEGLTPVYYIDSDKTYVYRVGNISIGNESVDWSADGYRLPTEAEWERACRGGIDRQLYSWGDTPDDTKGNIFARDDKPSYVQVGSYAPNAYGVNDMSGNGSEYVWDVYYWDYYKLAEATENDPRGPNALTNVIFPSRSSRSGFIYSLEYNRINECSCHHREDITQNNPGYHTFRCVISIPSDSSSSSSSSSQV